MAAGVVLDRAQPVVGGDRRLRGQQRHRRHQGIVRIGELEIERRREHDRPVEVDGVLLGQDARQRRDPLPAIALPRDGLRRTPTLVDRQPLADEAGNGVEVASDPVVGLAVKGFAVGPGQHAAVAGVDRVDEDEVGEADPAVGVLFQTRRDRGKAAVPGGHDRLRTDRGEVQVDAGGAGAAIEGKGHRSLGGIRALERVGDVEDLDIGALGVRPDLEHPGRGLVVRQLLRHCALWARKQCDKPECKHLKRLPSDGQECHATNSIR